MPRPIINRRVPRVSALRPRRPSRTSVALVVVVFIVCAIGSYACSRALREKAIEDCRERGGQAITSPWWDSENYMKVRCIEPGNR